MKSWFVNDTGETVAVYQQENKINLVCEQNMDFLNAELSDEYSYHQDKWFYEQK
jgi:hypothetical protein